MSSKSPVTSKGDKYGLLTVLERFAINDNKPTKKYPNGRNFYFCKCRCECGKEITVSQCHLRSGHTTSCGCQSSRNTIGQRNRHYNTYEINEDVVIVKDELGYEFLIDLIDLEKIKPFYWFGYKKRSTGGIYATTNTNNGKKTLHRFIMNASQNQIVDHINRNTQDCRRSNLRFATIAENCHNSISKNYSYDKARKKFAVYCKMGNKSYKKRVSTEEEAHHIAYLKRREWQGEFAWDYNLTEEESWRVLHENE